MKSYIPKIMADSNISVSQLSKMTGLSRTTITPLSKENTLPETTRISTLTKIAKALNKDTFELFSQKRNKFNVLDVISIKSVLTNSNLGGLIPITIITEFKRVQVLLGYVIFKDFDENISKKFESEKQKISSKYFNNYTDSLTIKSNDYDSARNYFSSDFHMNAIEETSQLYKSFSKRYTKKPSILAFSPVTESDIEDLKNNISKSIMKLDKDISFNDISDLSIVEYLSTNELINILNTAMTYPNLISLNGIDDLQIELNGLTEINGATKTIQLFKDSKEIRGMTIKHSGSFKQLFNYDNAIQGINDSNYIG